MEGEEGEAKIVDGWFCVTSSGIVMNGWLDREGYNKDLGVYFASPVLSGSLNTQGLR